MLPAAPERLLEIERRLAALEASMVVNTELTREIRDVIAAARLGLRVLGALGTLVRWIGGLAAAALAIWGLVQAMKTGVPPPPPKP